MNPEDNNKQSAPMTVGGVTFGGGGAPAGTPAHNTTPAQPAVQPGAPIDPILQSTGEEFDAVMNGQNYAPQQDFNQAPVPSNMNTQVASPTHFDSQNTVKPIVIDPGNPNANKMGPQKPAKKEKTPEELDKQVKKFSTLAVIFGILTAIFTTLSVFALVMFMNREADINNLTEKYNNDETILQAIREQTGAEVTSVDNIPVYTATHGYIYLSSWDIKIKIPDTLDKVSYILNENYHQSICFNAIGKGVQIFPDFANIAIHPGKMGCLTRILTNEGDFDPTTGISYGTKVFTYKDYSYFYTGPTDTSQKADELGLEHTAQQIIKDMLRDNIKPYE